MDVDQVKPRKKRTWTAPALFGAGCLFAFGVVWAIAALYPPFAGWNPSEAFLRASEVIRNIGLILVAIGGFGFAYWRGKQTDDQIQLTRDQFEAKETIDAASRDQDIYREASQLLANDNAAISFAGFTLLQSLERNSTLSVQAALLIDTFTNMEVFFNCMEPRDAAIIERKIDDQYRLQVSNLAILDLDNIFFKKMSSIFTANNSIIKNFYWTGGDSNSQIILHHCIIDNIFALNIDCIAIDATIIENIEIHEQKHEWFINKCLIKRLDIIELDDFIENSTPPNLRNCCIVRHPEFMEWSKKCLLKDVVVVETEAEGLEWLAQEGINAGLDPIYRAQLTERQRFLMGMESSVS